MSRKERFVTGVIRTGLYFLMACALMEWVWPVEQLDGNAQLVVSFLWAAAMDNIAMNRDTNREDRP